MPCGIVRKLEQWVRDMPTSERKTFKAKEVVADIKGGLDDIALMRKYGISAFTLQKLLNKLVKTGHLNSAALDRRTHMYEKTVDLGFKCPACGILQLTDFDECPACGVVVSQYHLVSNLVKERKQQKVRLSPKAPDPEREDIPLNPPASRPLGEWLILATKRGNIKEVERILAAGADVNFRGTWGMTPLIWAASKGHVKIVELLVSGGADVNMRANNQSTALMWASFSGHRDVVRHLLGGGADVDAKSNSGATALMAATERGHHETVRLLRDHGAKA